jgi:hypothetical protein
VVSERIARNGWSAGMRRSMSCSRSRPRNDSFVQKESPGQI